MFQITTNIIEKKTYKFEVKFDRFWIAPTFCYFQTTKM